MNKLLKLCKIVINFIKKNNKYIGGVFLSKYFTFNVPNCECEDCHYIAKQPFDKCPKCGSNNIEKTRSSLLVEYLRVIRANKPNFGMYENVKNIVGKQFKETTFKLFTDELKEYGYNVMVF